MGNWKGKPTNFDIKFKQILRYITNYIYTMLCYFVSNGVEIPMTNETFGFIWNGFGNKELIESETSSAEENYKAKYLQLKKTTTQIHLLTRTLILNGESRRTDITTKNRTTKRIFKNTTKRKRNNRAYVIHTVLI